MAKDWFLKAESHLENIRSSYEGPLDKKKLASGFGMGAGYMALTTGSTAAGVLTAVAVGATVAATGPAVVVLAALGAAGGKKAAESLGQGVWDKGQQELDEVDAY